MWKFCVENVWDYGFVILRRYIWDMMVVKIGNRDVMVVFVYLLEGNFLWEDWLIKVVVSMLKLYLRMMFDYLYYKVILVYVKN